MTKTIMMMIVTEAVLTELLSIIMFISIILKIFIRIVMAMETTTLTTITKRIIKIILINANDDDISVGDSDYHKNTDGADDNDGNKNDGGAVLNNSLKYICKINCSNVA